MEEMSKVFLESLSKTSNSMQEMIRQVSEHFSNTMKLQQEKFKQEIDRLTDMVKRNERMTESYQKLAEQVVCLGDERRRRQGEGLYQLVAEEKGKLEQKYGVGVSGNDMNFYQRTGGDHVKVDFIANN